MESIISQLKKSKHILIASHENPDGDAIGSLLATGLALQSIGKKTSLYNESKIPAVYRFLPKVNAIVRVIDDFEHYDTAVILDCGDLNRIGPVASRVTQVPVVINIDHHETNTRFGNLQLIDITACATAEIVYRLIKKMDISLSKSIATALYTGILTDTGSFRFSNTNQNAFSICKDLIEYGVEPYRIAQYVYGTYSLGRIKLLNLALDSIEISQNGQLSIMTLTQEMLNETGTHTEDMDGLINYARRIEDVKVAALIHELDVNRSGADKVRRFHVSLRSDGSLNVAQIAAALGGGGHSGAAGFSIESNLADLKAQINVLAEKLMAPCSLN
ncbi:MAG: bifunctional oligoribonuclease/PAP phosphatase NrnA [Desulfobacteraceae bacterium]|jgi:phosphoesterase RecJ-like protein